MPSPPPQVGDWVDTYDDEGEVIAIVGDWVYYHSEVQNRTVKRLVCSVTACPSPEQVAVLAQEIRASHNGQPHDHKPGPPKAPPEAIRRMLQRRGNNNHLR